jgi:hypothetical protein
MKKQVLPVEDHAASRAMTLNWLMLKAGCNDYDSRPVDFSQLRSRLARWPHGVKEAS